VSVRRTVACKASSPSTNGYGEDQQSDKSTRPGFMQRFGQLQTSVDLQCAAWHLCQFGHPLEHVVADQCWPRWPFPA
jgi:hypothetical protein